VGRAAADAVSHYGLYAGIAVVVLAALAIAAVHVWRRRVVEGEA
jgi:hypothetical protein